MASAPDSIPWYAQPQQDLKAQLAETRARELAWLLKDTQTQVLATVAASLEDCRGSLAAESPVDGSPACLPAFRLVVSSGRSDLVKGVLVRAGTQLVDFDIKVRLLAAGTHGVTIGGCATPSIPLHQNSSHQGRPHSHRDTGTSNQAVTGSITGPVPSTFGAYKAHGPESPYHPFEITMATQQTRQAEIERLLQQQKQLHQSSSSSSPSALALQQQLSATLKVAETEAPPLPLYQLIDTVNYLTEAVDTIAKVDYTNAAAVARMLDRLSFLVKTALECLKGPDPLPLYYSKNNSGTHTPAASSASTSSSDTEPGALTPVASASSSSLRNHYHQDDLVNSMYSTPESYLTHTLPENTAVSFYVSEGSVVTEVRVFEVAGGSGSAMSGGSNNSALDLSSMFRMFRRAPPAHEGSHSSNLLRVPSNSTAHTVSSSSSSSLHSADEASRTGGLLDEERVVRDFIRVESPDPNLISSGAKLRALLSHIMVLKRRVDLISSQE